MSTQAQGAAVHPAGHPQHGRITTSKLLRRLLFLTVGASFMAVGLEIFLVPNQVIDGGIVGISIITSHLSGVPLGLLLFLLNLPFLFIGYKQIGKTFALSTLYAGFIL